ncbi:nucleoside-diphosphate kinase [Cryptosporangium sp. NPDC048952]|uniref:nucleoside-diphosphate kinase n=1 Tax=Cryptosporangium sp. NPDC048952 TaxID=3363961 RepID=UPI00371BC638
MLYSVDTYFRDAWEDLSGVAGKDAVGIAATHALLLLKPDAVVRRQLTPAIDWLTTRGWRVAHAGRVHVNRWAIRAFWQYQWNTATRDRREMADLYMTATDSLLLVLGAPGGAEGAAETLTRAKGTSDPTRCRPGQLRFALGTLNQQLNLVHSADEPADLVREIGICCTEAERAVVFRAMAAGTDAEDVARRLARTLESEHEPLDLTLAGTVARLVARLGDEPEHARLRRCLEDVRDGRATGWRYVVGLAERAGVPLTRWDRVVLGTYLLDPTLPGVVPLLPDASAVVTS